MKISTIYINNTKISHLLRKGNLTYDKSYETNVGTDKSEIIINFQIDPPPQLNGKPEVLTYYDLAIADALYSIYKKSENPERCSFNLLQVLRAFSGDEKQQLTSQKKKSILNSIEKMQNTNIELDCCKDYENRKIRIDEPNAGLFEYGSFLPILPDESKSGKYNFTRQMPLYAYAEEIGQFVAVPVKMMRIPNKFNTDDFILIKRFLIQRLEVIRNKNNNFKNMRITYSRYDHNKKMWTGMFPQLGFIQGANGKYLTKDAWNHRRYKLHDMVTAVLDFYKESKYIPEGYKINRGESSSDSAIEGIELNAVPSDPWKIDWE